MPNLVTKPLIDAIVRSVLSIVPAKDDAALKQFITRLQPIAAGAPDVSDPGNKCYIVQQWFYCLRRYEEVNLKQNFMEFWPGTGGAYWGYLRLNPYFYDDQGRNRKIWELTHAFCYNSVRGQGINRLYVTLALALARVNHADLLIANPRHVSMLVTLTDMGFRASGGGGSQQSVRRVIKQGRSWYGRDQSARRMYYAEELRSFMTDGSLMMERKPSSPGFLAKTLFGIPLGKR
jgi:hypothetical protein